VEGDNPTPNLQLPLLIDGGPPLLPIQWRGSTLGNEMPVSFACLLLPRHTIVRINNS
jgi:hypothetical protein